MSADGNNSRKLTPLLTDTFFSSRGCPLTRELTVLGYWLRLTTVMVLRLPGIGAFKTNVDSYKRFNTVLLENVLKSRLAGLVEVKSVYLDAKRNIQTIQANAMTNATYTKHVSSSF